MMKNHYNRIRNNAGVAPTYIFFIDLLYMYNHDYVTLLNTQIQTILYTVCIAYMHTYNYQTVPIIKLLFLFTFCVIGTSHSTREALYIYIYRYDEMYPHIRKYVST